MKIAFSTVLALCAFPLAGQTEETPAHVNNAFRFTVPAPLSRAARLFGPEGERCWAGDHWNPEFIHPRPAKDIQGAVFTIEHGDQACG